jgi:hypothetical protein
MGRKGRIVMMSSVDGRIAFPFLGAYHASKFAMEGYPIVGGAVGVGVILGRGRGSEICSNGVRRARKISPHARSPISWGSEGVAGTN